MSDLNEPITGTGKVLPNPTHWTFVGYVTWYPSGLPFLIIQSDEATPSGYRPTIPEGGGVRRVVVQIPIPPEVTS